MKILCFGDSLTWGYTPEGDRYQHPWPSVLQECRNSDEVINAGMPGRTACFSQVDLTGLLERCHPDFTILMLGSNDLSLYCGHSVKQVISDLGDLGTTAQKYGKVLMLAPPLISPEVDPQWGYDQNIPAQMQELVKEIHNLTQKEEWLFFNTQNVVHPSVPDGLHINAESHRKLGKAIAKFLMENEKDSG